MDGPKTRVVPDHLDVKKPDVQLSLDDPVLLPEPASSVQLELPRAVIPGPPGLLQPLLQRDRHRLLGFDRGARQGDGQDRRGGEV